MSEILYYVTFDIIELHWTNIQNVIILCYNIVIIFYICPHNKYALQTKFIEFIKSRILFTLE